MSREAEARLPDFIGVGPPRTATTWLHRMLTGHVGLPRGTKELHFFSWNYALGLDWYTVHFRGYPPGLAVGEISPTYFDHPEAAARVARHIPNCKIIVSLREPVDRLYSNYRQLRYQGWIGQWKLEQALREHERWVERPGNMFGTSRYAFHLRRWFEAMSRENVLVTFYDDIVSRPQSYVDEVTEFIGVGRIDVSRSSVAAERVNSMMRAPKNPRLARRAFKLRAWLDRRRMYGAVDLLEPWFEYCSGRGERFEPLDPATERLLRERLRHEVEALEELIGRDLSHWKRSEVG